MESKSNFLVNSFLAVTKVHKANVKCKCIAHFCIKFSGTNGAVKMAGAHAVWPNDCVARSLDCFLLQNIDCLPQSRFRKKALKWF